jgi:hypothetical protein
MDKTNFILYKDYQSHVELLSDEQAGKLFKAIFKYVDNRQEPKLDGMTTMAFSFIKASLERDLVKYKKRVVASQQNGKLGGRPSKPNPNQDKPNKPSGLSSVPRKGDSVSVSVNDSVTVSDNVNDSDIDKPKKELKLKLGKYNNVRLTQKEYDKLKSEHNNIDSIIEWFSGYIEEKGYKSKSHNLTIRRWVIDAYSKNSNERITSKDVTDW